MITFICSIITNDQIQEIIGIILMVLEALLVVIKFLQYLVEPSSKFGKFLAKLLKGLVFVKSEVKTASKTIEKEHNENEQGERANPDNDGGVGDEARVD